MDYSLARLLCPGDFPGENTGAACHFLLLGNLLDPGIELTSLALTGGFLTTEPPGNLVRETDNRPITLEINPEMQGLCTRGIRLMDMSFGFYLHSRY